ESNVQKWSRLLKSRNVHESKWKVRMHVSSTVHGKILRIQYWHMQSRYMQKWWYLRSIQSNALYMQMRKIFQRGILRS
ncbi:hypothetical protein D917_10543, partial [Trichinella nativa]